MSATEPEFADTAIIRALVGYVLDHHDASVRELRAQNTLVRRADGTPSMVNLRLGGHAPRADIADGPLPFIPSVVDETDEPVGELLVWVTGGFLSAVEFAWWSDTPPTGLPTRDRLRAPGR